jgi:peptidoglycan-associated lipoprotein
MYFSSDGHVTFGQLDIVYAKEVNGKMTIENIGQPLNTSFDDFGIVFRDSTSGYFVSNRPDGEGDDDIYHFYDDRSAKYCIDGLALGSAKKNPQYVLPGTKVYLLAENGDTIARTVAADSGKFELCDIKPNTQFYLVAQKDGYFNQTKEDYVPVKIDEVPFGDLEPGENIIKKKATVKLVKLEQIVIVKNILYDYDKWNIRPDAAIELDKIVELMANNPQIKIELGSHTDERGSLEYNQKLAQKRAESAVKYIISKGISADRIFAKGYGESEPAIKNAKTEEEHQINRRTTFKVLNHFDDALEIKVE